MSFARSKPLTQAEARAKDMARIKRAALRALKRTKATADKAGVALSDWECDFIDAVSERVATYGRAFADPEKGGAGSALSALQTRKLKEIAAKANGETSPRRPRWRTPPKP